MQISNEQKPHSRRNIWPKLIIFTAIVLGIAVAISLLPRGFTQDTSIIGKGVNVVVLVYDPVLVQSEQTIIAMNEVRDEYEGRLEFVVANIHIPSGKTFADAHGVRPPALVFFAANGERLLTLYLSQDGKSLRINLDVVFK